MNLDTAAGAIVVLFVPAVPKPTSALAVGVAGLTISDRTTTTAVHAVPRRDWPGTCVASGVFAVRRSGC